MRIAAIHQRRIAGLPRFNRAAEIVHQRFAHQIFREITPCPATVIGADARQNAQPGDRPPAVADSGSRRGRVRLSPARLYRGHQA